MDLAMPCYCYCYSLFCLLSGSVCLTCLEVSVVLFHRTMTFVMLAKFVKPKKTRSRTVRNSIHINLLAHVGYKVIICNVDNYCSLTTNVVFLTTLCMQFHLPVELNGVTQ